MVGGSDDICNTLQDVALDALLGPEPRPTYVGTYGDSNSTITGDWVEIIQNENINAVITCVNILLALFSTDK